MHENKEEYRSQLEPDQWEDLKSKLSEATQKVDTHLVTTYVNLAKYSAMNGVQTIQVRNFKDRIDYQINSHIREALQNEEWLIDGVGHNTLRKNNLLPTKETPIQVKKVYEAFLRYDDKPLVSTTARLCESLVRYCQNGLYAIGVGDAGAYSNVYYKEVPPFFDVEDETYWLVDPSEYAKTQETEEETTSSDPEDSSGPNSTTDTTQVNEVDPTTVVDVIHTYEKLKISGEVTILDLADVLTFARVLKDNRVKD